MVHVAKPWDGPLPPPINPAPTSDLPTRPAKTPPTHVLLIPCDMITPEDAVELKARLRERLPIWVEPVLLGGGRGSATLIPYAPPEA